MRLNECEVCRIGKSNSRCNRQLDQAAFQHVDRAIFGLDRQLVKELMSERQAQKKGQQQGAQQQAGKLHATRRAIGSARNHNFELTTR